MGNICSTRDESDMREKQQQNNNRASSPGPKNTGNGNVFKNNPKGNR